MNLNNSWDKKKWAKERNEVGQATVDSLEEFAWRLQQRWGKGKLQRLASPQLAVAFKQAQQNFEKAYLEDDVKYMVQKANNLIQGWEALEKYAYKNGHKPNDIRIWYAIAPIECDAFTYAIVKDQSDMQFVDKESADRTYTLDEIATIIHKFEKNNSAATEIKDLFEGSEIQPNGDKDEKETELPFDDEIPY